MMAVELELTPKQKSPPGEPRDTVTLLLQAGAARPATVNGSALVRELLHAAP